MEERKENGVKPLTGWFCHNATLSRSISLSGCVLISKIGIIKNSTNHIHLL